MPTRRFLAGTMAMALLLAACGTAGAGQSSTPPEEADATVVAADMAFEG